MKKWELALFVILLIYASGLTGAAVMYMYLNTPCGTINSITP